jgi:hypothetical protein
LKSPKARPITPDLEEEYEEEIEMREYKSPAFDDVEKEFKDQLLSFTTDLLLSDFDLLKNISERGNKVLFHVEQLKIDCDSLFEQGGQRELQRKD